ncbi:MAG: stage V sporulation protein E [Candidatus Nealsonbacteria bacterium CG02_land_8_20_14_3_00_37_10]|uniref:Probable peptidoglycan glycosyltransferase FtsW n=1 Tax=Candidatus Nealsonbacteria bacterium CG02_land_8_20_14_3_00_37_10 TaxID=1974699 RepID=A0A2M7D918_9BACT|nr:MAG: stage V sporulation protein E [Candidatus Nealsonbacteria bacterium CG02_land_8_20_14_3_00_37_10]
MVAAKNSNQSFNYILLGVTGFLLALGIVILASVSAPYSQEKFGNTYYFLNHQIIYGLIPGLILGFLAFKISLSLIKKWVPFLLLGNLALLVMVFAPGIGLKIEGAARWISFGPISFQPSEFLKLTFILYLAAWLASRSQIKKNFSHLNAMKGKEEIYLFDKTLVVFLIIFGLISLTLIFQPDIGTLGVIFFIAALMYFANNTPFLHSILIILLGAVGLFSLAKLAPYRANRLLVFFNPEIDPMGIGYQLKQSLIVIGSGGITGVGLGMGIQKFFPGFLPHSISDSIFVAFSEETGFAGGLFLISLFLIFLWRGFKITKEAKDRFCQLTALGITSWIVVQAFVSIGAMIGVLPLIGIPLPFISYGGSALIASLIGVGILLNISKNA